MLALCLVISGIVSVCFSFELSYDFVNYHYYNPWAFLNDRIGYDIAPAGNNSYFSPFIDMPYYFLVKYFNDYPAVAHLIQSIYWGVLAFVFFKIILYFFDTATARGQLCALLTFTIGMTGFATFVQNGSTTNEIQIALLVMTAWYVLIRQLFVNGATHNLKMIFLSGLLLGAAMGFKLTAVTFCLSSGLALIVMFKKLPSPVKTISVFAAGGLAGFLITYGYWGWFLWQHLDNPFFPFADTFFQSPYFNGIDPRDVKFIPQTWQEWLFFPYIFAFSFEKQTVAEVEYYDIRYALAYTIALWYFVSALFGKRLTKDISDHSAMTFLAVVAIISYVIWMALFSIIRYAVPLEMILAIFIVSFFNSRFPQKEWKQLFYIPFCIVLVFALLKTADTIGWGLLKTDKIIAIEEFNLPENSLMGVYNFPVAAAIQPLSERSPGLRAVLKLAGERGVLKEQAQKIWDEHQGFKFVLMPLNSNLEEFDRSVPYGRVFAEGSKFYFNEPQTYIILKIISHDLGLDDFYCRAIRGSLVVSGSLYMCFDKKYKNEIFPPRSEK